MLFEDPDLIDLAPQLPELGHALALAISRPPSPLYAQLSDVLQRQLSGILTGQQAANQGMDQAQSSTNTVLQSSSG